MTDSKVYINNLPFVDWKDTDKYKSLDHDSPLRNDESIKKFKNDCPNEMNEVCISLRFFQKMNFTFTGFSVKKRLLECTDVDRLGDLVAGIHIRKPGIEYKITVSDGAIVSSGVSTGEPILFGDIYCEEKDNEVILKNALPLISLGFRKITINVSEPTNVEFYYVFLKRDIRVALATKPNILELCGKKYAIKSNEITRVD
jgi:hypothetical protein